MTGPATELFITTAPDAPVVEPHGGLGDLPKVAELWWGVEFSGASLVGILLQRSTRSSLQDTSVQKWHSTPGISPQMIVSGNMACS